MAISDIPDFGGGSRFPTQAQIVRDQQSAMQAGYEWGPQGWHQKPSASSAFGPSQQGSTANGGQTSTLAPTQNPMLLDENQYKQADYDPWSTQRAAAGQGLIERSNNDPSNIYKDKLAQMANPGTEFQSNDPSYQFRFQQGQQAVERSLAAKGMLNSGNAAMELQQYGQGAASQEFQAQHQRMIQSLQGVSQQYDTQMQRLMQMAGVNNDPTSAARLNQGNANINTSRVQNANSYALGAQQNNNQATQINNNQINAGEDRRIQQQQVNLQAQNSRSSLQDFWGY